MKKTLFLILTILFSITFQTQIQSKIDLKIKSDSLVVQKEELLIEKRLIDSLPLSLKNHDNKSNLFVDNLIHVKGGEFQMGCTSEQGEECEQDEKSVRTVTISDFYISKYEVTQKEWRDIMGTNPSYFENCDNCPVESITWDDVQSFLDKLNTKYPNHNYRLPTEAEWEYAARGGNKSKAYKYSGGNNIDSIAVYLFNSEYSARPIGTKYSNELGIYDMSGGVYEWCSDFYTDDYSNIKNDNNPQGPDAGSLRVFRGGSWNDYEKNCRVTFRNALCNDCKMMTIGFRIAASVK